MQPLENCIGPTIRIGREILCLPYAGFFKEFYLAVAQILVYDAFDSIHNQVIF